jgi:hypothetical protein
MLKKYLLRPRYSNGYFFLALEIDGKRSILGKSKKNQKPHHPVQSSLNFLIKYQA